MQKQLEYTDKLKEKIINLHGEDYFSENVDYFVKTGKIKSWIVNMSGIEMYGSDLNQLIIKHSVKIKELAANIGVTYQAISRWMYGITKPQPIYIEKIRSFFVIEAKLILKEMIDNNCDCNDIDSIYASMSQKLSPEEVEVISKEFKNK